jgi:hypothetical protein
MKRFFNVFVLTKPEQRLIIVVVLLLVAGAWYKHNRDLQNTARPPLTASASPTPPGATRAPEYDRNR